MANGAPIKKVHLDEMDKLIDLLKIHYFDVTEKFDPVFLKILSIAYKIRYLDTVESPISFGFFANQFLAELDFAIYFIEHDVLSQIKSHDGNEIDTFYSVYRKRNDIDLLSNNYILNGIDKKSHMETIGKAYGIYIDTNNIFGGLIEFEAENVMFPHNGSMWNMEFKPED